MSTSARRKRSKRFYWAEIGFLILGLIALKPEILTELIPTGRDSSQLATQAALNQVALNNALFGNASLAAGGNAVFVPVSGTLLYPANYLTPTTFASAPIGLQSTQPTLHLEPKPVRRHGWNLDLALQHSTASPKSMKVTLDP